LSSKLAGPATPRAASTPAPIDAGARLIEVQKRSLPVERIKDRLAKGEYVLAAGTNRLTHYNLIQMLGLSGFHAVWFDQEHGGLTTQQIELAALAARSVGLDCFVRVAPTDYALVTRCLESGASGIMAAQIVSAEQAEQVARWAKFAPQGCRGLNPLAWEGRFGAVSLKDFCERANQNTFVAIQIETPSALEECEQIAAIDLVDLLFLGPADLSLSLGVPGEFFHPKCLDAMKRIDEACRKHGKHWGAVCFNAKHGRVLAEHGCRLLSITSDVRMIQAGIDSAKRDFAEFFEQ